MDGWAGGAAGGEVWRRQGRKGRGSNSRGGEWPAKPANRILLRETQLRTCCPPSFYRRR
jgi:hypothetical protein